MLDTQQALSRLVSEVSTFSQRSERVPLAAASMRVLAEAIVAKWDLPTFDHSAMDGFAVRSIDIALASEETPIQLSLAAPIYAGDHPQAAIAPKTAHPIMTGARLPAGCDLVLRKERVRRHEGAIEVVENYPVDTDIRKKGEDVRAGELLVDRATRLKARHIAVAAAFGHHEIEVASKPRVAILCTGDELVDVQEATQEDVVDCNGPYLAALVAELGAQVVLRERVGDCPENLRAAVQKMVAAADFVVTVGGASVGDKDYLGAVVQSCGATSLVEKIAMRPGKPFRAARLNDCMILMLPGNPLAMQACAQFFLRPLLQLASGIQELETPILASTTLATDVVGQMALARPASLRAVHGRLCVTVHEPASSASFARMANADAWVKLAATTAALGVGELVAVVGDSDGLQQQVLPHLAFVGRSNSGKTTLLCRLIEVLGAQIRIACIKFSHHDWRGDQAGKDTWKLAQAGASSITFAGRSGAWHHHQHAQRPTRATLVGEQVGHADLVLIEGGHEQAGDKIEVVVLGQPPRLPDEEVIARVYRGGLPSDCRGLPSFEIEDLAGIVDFIGNRYRLALNG